MVRSDDKAQAPALHAMNRPRGEVGPINRGASVMKIILTIAPSDRSSCATPRQMSTFVYDIATVPALPGPRSFLTCCIAHCIQVTHQL